MKFLKSTISLVAATLSFGVNAATFDYAYTFTSGAVVSGSFDGSLSGDLVTNLTNISASFNGTPFTGSGSLFAGRYDSVTGLKSGGAVASFVLTKNNFFFSNDSDLAVQSWSNMFYSMPQYNNDRGAFRGAAVGLLGLGNGAAANDYSAYTYGYKPIWTLTQVAAPIPEPETYTMFLAGLGLMGAIARRKKQTA